MTWRRTETPTTWILSPLSEHNMNLFQILGQTGSCIEGAYIWYWQILAWRVLKNQVLTPQVFILYIANCNDQSKRRKYAVFIIPFILSRLIFLMYFSVNVNQIIMEQQMAMTYKRLKVPFSLIKNTNQSRFWNCQT